MPITKHARQTSRNDSRVMANIPAVIVILAVLTLIAAAEGLADIYRYIDDQGTECFTDTPTKKGAVRIMKEQRNYPRKTATVKHIQPPDPNCPTASPDHKVAEKGSGALADFVLPVRGLISSPVGLRHDPIDGMLRHHNGLDIAVPEGTPVKPAAEGVVYFSGCRNGYGNMVIITHDDGTVTIYAHNSVNLVREGERVTAGSTIALSGSTGRATGPHLHFEAWKDGVNMTMTFASGISGKGTAYSGLSRHEIAIRRVIQADGSLLFTNLP